MKDKLPILAFTLLNGKLEEVKIMEEGGGNLFMVVEGNNNLLHLVGLSYFGDNKIEALDYLLSKGLQINSKNSEVS